MALGRGHPDGAAPRRRAGRARPASTCCGSTPTSPGPSCTTPPTSRHAALAGLPAAVGLRPHASASRRCARRAEAVDLLGHHPSIAMWCGHNEPLALDVRPGEPVDVQAHRRRVRRRPGAADAGTRRCSTARVKRALEQADGTPAGHRPLRRAAPPRRSSTAPTATSTSAGTTATSATSPAFAAAMPRMVRFVSEFGAQAVPDDRRLHGARALARPRLGAAAASTTRCRRRVFDEHVPPADYATFDDWRQATQRYQATVLRHHIETLRRLKYRPTGGFCLVQLRRRHPGGDVVACSTTTAQPKLAYHVARRGVPPGDRGRRPAAGRRGRPATRWPSTSTSCRDLRAPIEGADRHGRPVVARRRPRLALAGRHPGRRLRPGRDRPVRRARRARAGSCSTSTSWPATTPPPTATRA